jgi:hypothetical protein
MRTLALDIISIVYFYNTVTFLLCNISCVRHCEFNKMSTLGICINQQKAKHAMFMILIVLCYLRYWYNVSLFTLGF